MESIITAARKWLQLVTWRRISLTSMKSSVPTTPASRPMKKPTPMIQSDTLAQNGSPLQRKARSVASAPNR